VILREAPCDRILMVDNHVAPDPGCRQALTAAPDASPRAVIAMPAVILERVPERVQYVGADAHFLGTVTLRKAGDAHTTWARPSTR
jgi:hypothetical protein